MTMGAFQWTAVGLDGSHAFCTGGGLSDPRRHRSGLDGLAARAIMFAGVRRIGSKGGGSGGRSPEGWFSARWGGGPCQPGSVVPWFFFS